MRSDVRDLLTEWLGTDLRAVEVLPDKDLEVLYAAVLAARKRQAMALAAASEEALRQMPAPVRGTVRKILGS
jgi:hypothetical protein